MANSVTTQILEDGPRNLVLNVIGVLDTADVVAGDNTMLVTVSALATDNYTATRVRLKESEYDVEDGLTVELWWDATTDVRFGSYSGRGEICYDSAVLNNAGAGVTGNVQITTNGFSFGDSAHFTLKLKFEKY